MIQSSHSFARAMTDELSWQVQNHHQNGLLESKLEENFLRFQL